MAPPTYPAALIGYRRWSVIDDQLGAAVLGSRVAAWHPGLNTASCAEESHEAPARGCACGFNALHRFRTYLRVGEVCGVMIGWGDVEVHLGGFRCQYARPVALLLPFLSLRRRQIKRLGRAYDLPLCRTRWGLRRLARRAGGIEAPEELVPSGRRAPRWRERPESEDSA